jgi:hypothetical protein
MKIPPLIFMSYARDDEEEIKLIYRRLQNEGCRPWMDQFDILPGENWERSIKSAIQKADFFLFFLSNYSVNRRGFLQKEIRLALDAWNGMLMSDIYLIPMRLSPCQIPDELSSFQWVDYFDDSGWAKLVLAIEAGLKRRKNDPKRKK